MTPAHVQFAVIGGQRCGTTWLAERLDEHPEIQMARPLRPEPKYFLREGADEADLQRYLSLWDPRDPSARAFGEKSTTYMEDPAAPGRMVTQIPALRVIAVLRHPVERALSNHRFSSANGYENLSFDEAIEAEASRTAGPVPEGLSTHPGAYIARGRYADLLAPYFEAFTEDRRLIVLFDELRSSAPSTMDAVFHFLGVDPSPAVNTDGPPVNASTDATAGLRRSTLDRLLSDFADSNARLESMLGVDLSAWSRPTQEMLRLVSD